MTEALDTSSSMDQQIVDLERYANLACSAERFAYDQGFLNGRQSILEDMSAELSSQVDAAKDAAELYQVAAKDLVPGFPGFSDLRVGLNQTMGGLGILAVMPQSQASSLRSLRRVARIIEKFYWDRRHVDLSICNLASDLLDRERVAHDFPIYRVPCDG